MNNYIENQIIDLVRNDPDITDYQIISLGHVIGKKDEFESYIKQNPNFRDYLSKESFTTEETKNVINDSLRVNEIPKSAKDSFNVFMGMDEKKVLETLPIELPSGEEVYKSDIEQATEKFINSFASVETKDAINDSVGVNDIPKSAKDSYDVFKENDYIKDYSLEPSHNPLEALVPYQKPLETPVPYKKEEEPEKQKVTKNKGKWKKALIHLTTTLIILGTVVGVGKWLNKDKNKDKVDVPTKGPETSDHIENVNSFDGFTLGNKVDIKELKGMISSLDNDSISLLSKESVGIDSLYANKFSLVSTANKESLLTSIEENKTEKSILKDYINASNITKENKELYTDLVEKATNENDLNTIKTTLGVELKVHVGADKTLANNNTSGQNPYAWENTDNLVR